jgi:hypothetical protein
MPITGGDKLPDDVRPDCPNLLDKGLHRIEQLRPVMTSRSKIPVVLNTRTTDATLSWKRKIVGAGSTSRANGSAANSFVILLTVSESNQNS